MSQLLAFHLPGGWEWIVILVVALLIFGRRLPEMGRSLGKGIVEFKKGLKGMKGEMDSIHDEVDEAVRKDEEEKPARLEKRADESSVVETGRRAVEERDKVES